MTETRKLPPPLPPRLDWFVQTQVEELTQDGIPEWFHGAISRETAENLLDPRPPGSFLIRVSHSHVGYTLSYRAPGCCRHFMVKLLDDGSLMIPGEQAIHPSLDALVAFHQQHPLRPHGELLMWACGQDPETVDYADLFLYSLTLAEGAAHEQRRHSSCPAAAPEEAPPKPVPLPWPEDGKPSAEMLRASTEDTASSRPMKAPLRDTRQKLWKNLKMLPQKGKRAQQQLRAHLATVSLPLLWNPGQSTADNGAGSGAGSQEDSVYTGPSQPQTPGHRAAPSREVLRSSSWGGMALTERVVRALSRQASKQEPGGLVEPQESWLPEEYLPPPPFAPGYC
ncbi:hematopoietic SH2 domain-containing protein [Choloepus didactylus]|uniref:hematopoietic SH2 domain-containing protein n=1 Tax=Choloepus didactylus TaxID=27675 RepID=UPI00189F12E9|nr:hematopoietic SH2 domain-containing protein [Choloepus didactylus]